jgi:hypothetical protein
MFSGWFGDGLGCFFEDGLEVLGSVGGAWGGLFFGGFGRPLFVFWGPRNSCFSGHRSPCFCFGDGLELVW